MLYSSKIFWYLVYQGENHWKWKSMSLHPFSYIHVWKPAKVKTCMLRQEYIDSLNVKGSDSCWNPLHVPRKRHTKNGVGESHGTAWNLDTVGLH